MSDLEAGCGFSTKSSIEEALAEAIEQAQKSLSVRPGLALITMSVDYPLRKTWDEIKKVLPGVPVHAVTTSLGPLSVNGVVSGASGSIGVQFLASPSQSVRFASAGLGVAYSTKATTLRVCEQLQSQQSGTPRMLWLGASPGDEESVLEAIAEFFPGVPVWGGTAGDHAIDGSWRVFTDHGAVIQGVALAGIWGDVQVGSSMVAPYSASKTEGTVTQSDRRTLVSIDGQPAAKVLRKWVGDAIQFQSEEGGPILVQTSLSPLGIRRTGKDGDFYSLLHPAHIHQPEGKVDVFALPHKGDVVCLMHANRQSLVTVGNTVAREALSRLNRTGSKIRAGLLIYCAGCAGAVGDGLNDAIAQIKEQVGEIALLGRCTFGEQGHLEGLGNLHTNLSVCLVLLTRCSTFVMRRGCCQNTKDPDGLGN